jgi:hypothetical protein
MVEKKTDVSKPMTVIKVIAARKTGRGEHKPVLTSISLPLVSCWSGREKSLVNFEVRNLGGLWERIEP